MGPCISQLVINPMLRLGQLTCLLVKMCELLLSLCVKSTPWNFVTMEFRCNGTLQQWSVVAIIIYRKNNEIVLIYQPSFKLVDSHHCYGPKSKKFEKK
jgi:hypothetical protein